MFIKKSVKFIAVCLFSLACSHLQAQKTKFQIGIEMGPSLSRLYGNDIVAQHGAFLPNFTGGVFVQKALNSSFSWRTGLQYDRKGATTVVQHMDAIGSPLGNLTIQNRFNYVTMPILFQAQFGKKISYFFNVGPYVSYLISQNEITQGIQKLYSKLSYIQNYHRFDVGASTGVGLRIPVKAKAVLGLEIRNNLGLYHISKMPMVNQGSLKNNATQLLISVSKRI